MFSAEFTTIHKYNLKTKERVSTVSIMPYDYTSLYDPQYLPELSEKSFDVLKSICAYRFIHTAYPLYDDAKLVKIEHHDGNILGYEVVNSLPYYLLSNDIRNWKHFISTIQCEEMDSCKESIDKMTDITDIGVTYLTSIEYNKDCDFSYVNIFDSSYNLIGYDDYQVLHRMNDFCKNLQEPDLRPVGVIGFSSSKNIKFTIKLNYHEGVYVYSKLSPLPSSIEVPTKAIQREKQLSQMVAYGLLEPEDLDFIDSVSTDDTRCDFEFILNEDGSVKDVYLHNCVVYEFKNLLGA